MELKKEIDKWLEETGIDQLHPYDTGEIAWALNIGKELSSMEAAKVDEAMLILSNYRIMLAYKMGMCFARLKTLESIGPRDQVVVQRAKLNIIKPFHDAVEAKVAVLKKVHDRKVKNATGGGR